MVDNIEILFGVFLIVIYALERFNSPPTIRASTTAGRYYAASFVYLLIYLMTFYIFTKYPQLLNYLNLSPEITEDSPIKSANSTPVFVAMLLSLLLPKVLFFSELDARLRRFLHRLAAIPYEAIRLSKEIQQTRFQIPESIKPLLVHELVGQGFDLTEVETDSKDAVIQRWINISSLMLQLEEWEISNQFSTFVHDRNGQYERIKERYKRLTTMTHNEITLNQQASEQPKLEALQDAVIQFRTNLHEEQNAMFSEICDFISHGILKTCFRYGSRANTLQNMGFQNFVKNDVKGLSVNHTIALFGLLLALVLINFIIFRPPDSNVERILLMITMIVSIYSAAVICAVFPKQRWIFFQHEKTKYYPSIGYMASGLLAISASIFISLFFKALIFASDPEVNGINTPFSKAWENFTTDSYPWLIMSFVTAVTTAFLIDWRHPRWLRERWQRITEAGIQAIMLVIAAMLVHWWLTDLSVHEQFSGRVPDLGSVLRVSSIIGFVLGYFVPTWYRDTTVERTQDIALHARDEDYDKDIIYVTPLQSSIIKHINNTS